jgi:hypothetical protein
VRCYRRRRSPPEGHGQCRLHGHGDAQSQQADVAIKVRVASVCFMCFRCFRSMLQLFYIDIAKVDRRYCTCCKYFRVMLVVFKRFVQNILFVPNACCKRYDLDASYVLHICCNNIFQIKCFCCLSLILQ